MLESQEYIRSCKIPRVHPSIRDFVRGFNLYQFFLTAPGKAILGINQEKENEEDSHWLSLLMSLSVTYYFRLPDNLDHKFQEKITALMRRNNCPIKNNFAELVEETLSKFFDQMEIPPGIAKTKSLQINLFCNVVCMEARIPLLITGVPGRSKTLSFNLACDNMKGPRSKKEIFRGLCNVNRFHYQCSESSTASEIDSVYKNAVENQTRFEDSLLPNEQCVVFLDEGG